MSNSLTLDGTPMNKNYGCSECNKMFGRKYNAEHHNENIHDNLATI